MQPILVTGGAGFIGARLVRRLIETHRAVAIILRPKTDLSRIEDLLPRLECYEGDLTSKESLVAIAKKVKPRGVFHLAASNMQSGVAGPDQELVHANVMGMVNLLSVVKDMSLEFFINTGSFLEYSLPAGPVKETDRCEPMELYSITKLAATLYGQMTARRNQKPIATFRIFSPYGPGMQKGRLLESLISRALLNEDILMTEEYIARDFIFVEDIVDLYLEAMGSAGKTQGEVFNAGTGRMTTLRELVDVVLRMTQSKSNVQWNALPHVSYDSPTWQADMAKTFGQFNWRPKHSLEEGILKTIAWYQAAASSKKGQ